MSDADLRKLERRFRETISVEDEAAWLRERVRAGELSPAKVGLAASCGHRASRVVLGPTRGNYAHSDADDWLADLGKHGRKVLERVCVAMSRSALPVWVRRFQENLRTSLLVALESLPEYEIDSSRPWETFGVWPFRAVEAMERGILCTEPSIKGALDAPSPLGLCEGATLGTPGETAASCAAVAIQYSNSAVFRASDDNMTGMAGVVYLNACRAIELDGRREGESTLAAGIEAELAPWALGYSDPVRERVEARRRPEATGE